MKMFAAILVTFLSIVTQLSPAKGEAKSVPISGRLKVLKKQFPERNAVGDLVSFSRTLVWYPLDENFDQVDWKEKNLSDLVSRLVGPQEKVRTANMPVPLTGSRELVLARTQTEEQAFNQLATVAYFTFSLENGPILKLLKAEQSVGNVYLPSSSLVTKVKLKTNRFYPIFLSHMMAEDGAAKLLDDLKQHYTKDLPPQVGLKQAIDSQDWLGKGATVRSNFYYALYVKEKLRLWLVPADERTYLPDVKKETHVFYYDVGTLFSSEQFPLRATPFDWGVGESGDLYRVSCHERFLLSLEKNRETLKEEWQQIAALASEE